MIHVNNDYKNKNTTFGESVMDIRLCAIPNRLPVDKVHVH